ALRTATEAEVNLHGYTLMNAGNLDQALVMFRKNVKDHPESWNVYDSLGEALDKAGKKSEAITNYRKALAMAPAAQKGRIEGILKTLDGKS
ncbi:MAG: tetratricopeptide repeat protein, partial [Thermoanaerobaculia bacterium]